jgi:hypothetical protein
LSPCPRAGRRPGIHQPRREQRRLRQALTQGASAAVASLGKPDGFLGNPKVKIPLPENLQKAEKLMRKLGMGKHADELIPP